MADEKKRRRMESNRESARRSRIKKQQQLQQVLSHIDLFERRNIGIASQIEETRKRYFAVETEMNLVAAQKAELELRLNHLLSLIEKTEKNLTRRVDVGRLSVELPSYRSDTWFDFSGNKVPFNNGDGGGGSGSLSTNGLDFDRDLSLSPWRFSCWAPSPSPLMASAATMSQT